MHNQQKWAKQVIGVYVNIHTSYSNIYSIITEYMLVTIIIKYKEANKLT